MVLGGLPVAGLPAKGRVDGDVGGGLACPATPSPADPHSLLLSHRSTQARRTQATELAELKLAEMGNGRRPPFSEHG